MTHAKIPAGSTEPQATNPELPFEHQAIPVMNGLQEFQAFQDQYPGFMFCPYIAAKSTEEWDRSTSRIFMNQALPGFMYVPVNIEGANAEADLGAFLEAVRDDARVAAVNITQPYKGNPAVRNFLGDPDGEESVDVLVRERGGSLHPYDLNGLAFTGWYTHEVGRLDRKVVMVGAGGAGSAILKAIKPFNPHGMVLVDPQDRSRLAAWLGGRYPAVYHAKAGEVTDDDLEGDVTVINAAGLAGANASLALLDRLRGKENTVFVDLRPQPDIGAVELAKRLGADARNGFGMLVLNDYMLLGAIAGYMERTPPEFGEFQALVRQRYAA